MKSYNCTSYTMQSYLYNYRIKSNGIVSYGNTLLIADTNTTVLQSHSMQHNKTQENKTNKNIYKQTKNKIEVIGNIFSASYHMGCWLRFLLLSSGCMLVSRKLWCREGSGVAGAGSLVDHTGSQHSTYKGSDTMARYNRSRYSSSP